MKTQINLRFEKGTKLGNFIYDNEIDQLDEYDEMFDISDLNFLPRIGERFYVGFGDGGYQQRFLMVAQKINNNLSRLFDESFYEVKDIRYIMGSDYCGDIIFIEIWLGYKKIKTN
jgi:hypothetical protein